MNAASDALVGALLRLTKLQSDWKNRPEVVAELLAAAVLVADALEATNRARLKSELTRVEVER